MTHLPKSAPQSVLGALCVQSSIQSIRQVNQLAFTLAFHLPSRFPKGPSRFWFGLIFPFPRANTVFGFSILQVEARRMGMLKVSSYECVLPLICNLVWRGGFVLVRAACMCSFLFSIYYYQWYIDLFILWIFRCGNG